MASEYRFKFPLPNGLHARPASHLQSVAKRFAADVILRVESRDDRASRSANAKSVLSLVGADVRLDDVVVLVATGADEAGAMAELRRFVAEVLPGTDDAIAAVATGRGEVLIPRSLRAAGLGAFHRGTQIGSGFAMGTAVLAGRAPLAVSEAGARAMTVEEEAVRYKSAVAACRKAMLEQLGTVRSHLEKDVLDAHLAILDDVELGHRIFAMIRERALSAAAAVVEAAGHFGAVLRSSASAYLRERALDVEDVCGQLLEAMGERVAEPGTKLAGPSVVIAESLPPSDFLKLDRKKLRGLVLREGGTTSHTVILARSAGIPTLVGVEEAPSGFVAGAEVVVDATLGIAIPEVNAGVRRYYALEARRAAKLRERWEVAREGPAVTTDGQRLEVGCNVASAGEVAPAMEAGAEGIGLFRTEMIFVERDSAPSEEEQVEIYGRAARDAGGRAVIVRLIDIGGDKPAPYLDLPAEENPFLGCRGVRLYAELRGLVKSQVRAILRASAEGELKILVPMIACVEEIRLVRGIIDEAAKELGAEGRPVARVPELGAMVEVPAAAMLIPELSREVAFFSIGSNDLAQYSLAADRGNAKLSWLYSWAQPAFLRLLKSIVSQAREAGRWVGLCGEMGDDLAALPLLLGMGLDEISVSPANVAPAKAAIAATSVAACREMLAAALACSTKEEVHAVVAKGVAPASDVPMLSDDLILFGSDATSKEEVIKQLADALAVAGRTDKPALVEEALWRREETYSTGFGHGLAVPHCKSEHLRAGSIGIAKLNAPVVWGSLDGNPVDVVIMLAIRASDHDRQHMKVFSQLSRLVMRDEFRDGLRAETDPRKLREFLEQSLGLAPATVTA